MNPAELEKELKSGKIRPVYLIAGEERFLVEQCTRTLRARCVDPAMADFNEEVVTAGEVSIHRLMSAVRTAPLMADRRFVLVRSLERWEGRSEEKEGPLELLAKYAEQPVSSTCLVLVAGKLDGRRKLPASAKKQGYLVSCEHLDRRALRGWIEKAFKDRGHPVEGGVSEFLAEIAGPELGYVSDAVERLCLFVGLGGKITNEAVSSVVAKVRETDIWELTSAVGARDFPRALSLLDQVYAPREGVLLVATLASSIRKLFRFALAIRAGVSPEEAAKTSGVPPFKVREVASQARAFSPDELERWMFLLAEADGALKGSRRPERAVLDGLLLDLVGKSQAAAS